MQYIIKKILTGNSRLFWFLSCKLIYYHLFEKNYLLMNFFHSYYLLKIFFTLYCIFCIFISLMNIQKLTICMINFKTVSKTIKTVNSYFFPRLYLVGPEILSGRDFMVPPIAPYLQYAHGGERGEKQHVNERMHFCNKILDWMTEIYKNISNYLGTVKYGSNEHAFNENSSVKK